MTHRFSKFVLARVSTTAAYAFLHGLQSREMCDKIIDKKPTTFAEAYKIAHTLETTRDTSNEVKITGSDATSEAVHKLGCASLQYKRHKKDVAEIPNS